MGDYCKAAKNLCFFHRASPSRALPARQDDVRIAGVLDQLHCWKTPTTVFYVSEKSRR